MLWDMTQNRIWSLVIIPQLIFFPGLCELHSAVLSSVSEAHFNVCIPK